MRLPYRSPKKTRALYSFDKVSLKLPDVCLNTWVILEIIFVGREEESVE